MYAAILKGKQDPHPDTCCEVDEDGNLSNGDLHAKILAPIPVTDDAEYGAKQCSDFLTEEELAAVFPAA